MTFSDYLVNIVLIGLVLLQIRGRKITAYALLMPLGVTAYVAMQYLHGVPTAGNDLVLEVGLAATGCLLGVLAGLATDVRRVGESAVARAGAVAATLWILGVGSRMAFEVWVSHGGQPAVDRFSVLHHITSGEAWVAAFILMALSEVVSRTGVIYLKVARSGAAIPRGGFLHRAAVA